MWGEWANLVCERKISPKIFSSDESDSKSGDTESSGVNSEDEIVNSDDGSNDAETIEEENMTRNEQWEKCIIEL